MNADQAFAKQIEIYRAMTGEQRLASLSASTNSPTTSPLKASATNTPAATVAEAEKLLAQRLALTRTFERET